MLTGRYKLCHKRHLLASVEDSRQLRVKNSNPFVDCIAMCITHSDYMWLHNFSVKSKNTFCHAVIVVLCISMAYAVMHCLSVCLSVCHVHVLCQNE